MRAPIHRASVAWWMKATCSDPAPSLAVIDGRQVLAPPEQEVGKVEGAPGGRELQPLAELRGSAGLLHLFSLTRLLQKGAVAACIVQEY